MFFILLFMVFSANAMHESLIPEEATSLSMLHKQDDVLKERVRNAIRLASRCHHQDWTIYTIVYRFNIKTGTMTCKGINLRCLTLDDLIDLKIGNFIYYPDFRNIKRGTPDKTYRGDALFLGVTEESYWAYKNLYYVDESKKK